MARLLLALLLLPQDDTAEKHAKLLRDLLDAGRYVEARGLAEAMVKKYKGGDTAEKAARYTEENGLYRIAPLEVNGPEPNRLDLAFLADGIELDDKKQAQWDKECDALVKTLMAAEPMKSYRRCFNLWRLNVVSKEERLNPLQGAHVTALGGREDEELTADTYAASKMAREIGTKDDLLFLNVRPAGSSHGKSGSGAAILGGPRPSKYRILHAWGHAFAGLADEHTDPIGRRRPDAPPEAPNVSATDAPSKVPWKHWIAARMKEDRRAKGIDILEGAARMEKGAWRPVQESACVMNSGQEYCPVCREAMVLALYTWLRPIDTSTPFERPHKAPAEISLVTLPVKMTVEWFVERTEAKEGSDAPDREVSIKDSLRIRAGRAGIRTGLGPEWKPPAGTGMEGIRKPAGELVKEVFETSKLAKGRWKVTVVVTDPTEWVLHDGENLLKDTRSWIVDAE